MRFFSSVMRVQTIYLGANSDPAATEWFSDASLHGAMGCF